MSTIKVTSLHKHYGPLHVLRGIDFEVNKGEGVVLLGANGCGKSTLMRCLNGLTPVGQGQIVINDVTLGNASRRQLKAVRRPA